MQYVVTIPLKPSLFISLCILRELPQQKIPRASCGGGDPVSLYFYIPIFLWKDFLMGWIRKSQNQEERDTSGKLKETRKKEWRKEKKKRFLCTWRFPYPCVLHQLGMPWGYRPRATLPQENPLMWEPPLQQKCMNLERNSVQKL